MILKNGSLARLKNVPTDGWLTLNGDKVGSNGDTVVVHIDENNDGRTDFVLHLKTARKMEFFVYDSNWDHWLDPL